ncbi:MAG: hypothetical protein HOH19_12640 [Kordiimonadaceae bacterium]|jgi:hypothetical protein|nr:hypothetical protein [Kordiimonadaceae bacterium]MBT6033415.1 hypothetical protein [Kordiimonadaceae bacterium]
MSVINRLKKIFTDKIRERKSARDDLVRQHLMRNTRISDYNLENISAPVVEETIPNVSPVQENIAYAEAKLAGAIIEDQETIKAMARDKELTFLEMIEQLRCKAKISWIDRIEPTFSSNKPPKNANDH